MYYVKDQQGNKVELFKENEVTPIYYSCAHCGKEFSCTDGEILNDLFSDEPFVYETYCDEGCANGAMIKAKERYETPLTSYESDEILLEVCERIERIEEYLKNLCFARKEDSFETE